MRVTGGDLKGRKYYCYNAHIRPTTDLVRSAVFSTLSSRDLFHAGAILDLFAGSGGFGIEALSRGAKEAVFVESSKKVAQLLKNNLINLSLLKRSRIYKKDALSFLKDFNQEGFEIAFLDPPYDFLDYVEVMSSLRVPIVVLETRKTTTFRLNGLKEISSKIYGDSKIAVFENLKIK